ncbi:MAG: site-2 protease family protein [Fibrobacterota bacterium]
MNTTEIILRIPAILIALTVHEYAHGYIAYRKGDTTAFEQGRLTLNPFPHLSFLGTLMLFFGPIGWAKPVPVQPGRMENPRKSMVHVGLAGPVSNIILAVITGILLHGVTTSYAGAILGNAQGYTIFFFVFLYIINLGLALFNLIPVSPLDGFNIITGLLPQDTALAYARYTRHAPHIFLGLLVIEWLTRYPVFSTLIVGPIFTPWFRFWNSLLLPREIAYFVQNQIF